MSLYKKVYDRTIARLLADYTKQGIPADTDLWPTIQKRLALRAAPSEEPATPGHADRPNLLSRIMPQQERVATDRTARRSHPYLGAAAATLGLLILAGVSWVAISGLAQRQERIALGSPTPLPIEQPAEDTTLVFSVPVGEEGIRYVEIRHGGSGSAISGFFTVAPDGTFWIGSDMARLLHYSPEGKLLGTVDLPPIDRYPSDMIMEDTHIWLLYTTFERFLSYTDSPYGPSTVYKVSRDGRKLAEYAVPDDFNLSVYGLMLGEHGEVFLKGAFGNMGGPFLNPALPTPAPSASPGTVRYPLWQLVDADGNLENKPLEGYTRNGKLYFARFFNPDYMTNGSETNRAFIKAGDLEFTVALSNTLVAVDMLSVEPDGSFHVLFVEEHMVNSYETNYDRTIFHYVADGHLIERARLPSRWANLVRGPRGQFYILTEVRDETQGGNALPKSVEVRRLNFYNADQPLPPLPTATLMPAPVQTISPATVP
ncbi:MAG TPA: hypothetical protein VEW94_13060 [Chloroflexia bacterium]|nr:hypothetical protein [Chloroflexia bacterium]